MAYGTNGYYGGGTIGYPTYNPYPNSSFYQQPQQPTQTMFLVNSEQEASSWNVLPGNSLFFMDSNNKLFYIKSVDFSGIVSFKKFKFDEVIENESIEENKDYITREEFEKRLSSLSNHKPYSIQKKGDKIDG